MTKFLSLTAAAFMVAAATPTLAATEDFDIVPAAVDVALGERLDLTSELIFDPAETIEALEGAQRPLEEHVIELAQYPRQQSNNGSGYPDFSDCITHGGTSHCSIDSD